MAKKTREQKFRARLDKLLLRLKKDFVGMDIRKEWANNKKALVAKYNDVSPMVLHQLLMTASDALRHEAMPQPETAKKNTPIPQAVEKPEEPANEQTPEPDELPDQPPEATPPEKPAEKLVFKQPSKNSYDGEKADSLLHDEAGTMKPAEKPAYQPPDGNPEPNAKEQVQAQETKEPASKKEPAPPELCMPSITVINAENGIKACRDFIKKFHLVMDMPYTNFAPWIDKTKSENYDAPK